MITENFDNYKTGGSHKEFNIEVVGTDTVIGNTNMLQESITLDEALCSDNNLKFGACEASQFSVQVANIFDDFVDKELIVSVTMDGVTTKYGTFKVDSDKPTADRVWRVLTCYDRMKDIINANVLEWYKGLTFPMSQKAYRDSFFTYLGIEQVNVSLINDDFMVQGGFTATDTLSGKTIITSICEFNGVFGHINRDGKFDYVSLDGASIVECPPYENNSVTYEDYETDYITRVTMRGTASDVGTSVGVDGNEYIITNNPIIYGTEGTDELITALTRLLNKIGSISYRPYSVGKTIGNPCVEIGDAITINTRHQTINSYVIKRTLTGIQALRDKYSATGSKVYPVEVNSVREEILRTQGKMNILTRTVDETKSQIIAIQTDLTDNYLTSTQTQTLINQSASQIQATVTQTITAELPDLVDEVTGGLSDRITVVESSYTQLSNEIVMKVKADGTVAQVALGSSAELGSNVLIKGDNIQLDGDVTITDGFRLTAGVIQSANYQEDDHGFATQGMQVTLSDGILNTPTFKIDDAGAHFIDSLYVRQKVYMDDIFYGKYRDVSIITGYVRASSDIMMETDGLIIHKNEIKILEHYHDSSSFSEHLELYGNEILFLAENYIQNKISAGAMLYIPTDNSSNDGAQADVYGDFRAFGTITSNALTASRILVSDERKRITSSSLSVSDLITTSNIGSQSVAYADTAHALRTYGAGGGSHGTGWLLNCQHNRNGDNRFNIYCGDGSLETSVAYAYSSTNASHANNADNSEAVRGIYFNWAGQGGQPTWLWGGNNASYPHMYVYNPSNFSVSSAGTATYASHSGVGGTSGYIMHGRDYSQNYSCHWTGSGLQFWVGVTNVATISDMRLKKDKKRIDDKIIQAIGECPIYTYKADNRGGLISAGIMAQSFVKRCKELGINPLDYEVCQKTEYRQDDWMQYYVIEYNQYSVIKLAYHDKQIAELKDIANKQQQHIDNLINEIDSLKKSIA